MPLLPGNTPLLININRHNVAIKPRQLKKKKIKSDISMDTTTLEGLYLSLDVTKQFKKYRNVTISVRDRETVSFHTTDVRTDQGSV